jgi:uncharacterized protein (DUF924 family)
MSLVRSVLDFWFGAPGTSGQSGFRDAWFRKDPAFDAEIRRQFADEIARAAKGEHDRLAADPEGALALTIVLDQFPRNIYRGQPKAYAADAKARSVASDAVGRRFDSRVEPVQRLFFYLPVTHAETLAEQHRCVELCRALVEAAPALHKALESAIRHREIVERFGRFPHRNDVLGRESTEAEIQFLKEPNSSF